MLILGIGAQNTSNQSFTIYSIAGNIYSKEGSTLEYVANVSSFTPQVIPANAQGIFYVDAKLQLIGLANEIIEAITNRNFSKTIVLKLMANVDHLQIPINQTLNIGL